MSKNEFIAHVRKKDQAKQSLESHLQDVSAIAGELAAKIGMREAGQLLGIMHDFGKYSKQFQDYIGSATGILNSDIDDDFVDADALKGKIDHSSAGAQWVWNTLKIYGAAGQGELCGQILALCIASHHSGLIDCLKPEGKNGFDQRMSKDDSETNLRECIEKADKIILEKASGFANQDLLRLMLKQIVKIHQNHRSSDKLIPCFHLGLWARFLFSCLIDADRINSADFENPHYAENRSNGLINWSIALNRLENYLSGLEIRNQIDVIRRNISNDCKEKACQPQGIYTLTVPTGGGKTFSSLRYALHHAQHHKLDHIIYVIPYTSIIEQNAQAVRYIIEDKNDSKPWILEHHSNLDPVQQTWRSKLVSDNWDAPIIFTTMVQFLESLFSGGTRDVRRMHQLANSVIIFDEIQTLPINCVHLFCNAINFLTTYTKTTAVLCTATQPLLDKLTKPEKGQLSIPAENELVKNKAQLFDDLKRVNVCNQIKTPGWSEDEIVELAIREFTQKGSCLIVVNTKVWAKKLFEALSRHVSQDTVFHLSTNQCSSHRKEILDSVRARLTNNLPVLCVSTQLIEAGVDIDFASAIRFVAGLDSIAQTAGRCNRNGRLKDATVYIVNPTEEKIDSLIDINIGKKNTLRVLSEVKDSDLLEPSKMSLYFSYYFYDRWEDMVYRVALNEPGHNLLSLLSENKSNRCPEESNKPKEFRRLRHSFMAAGRIFNAIDAPTKSVIVPFGEGEKIISELCAVAKEFNAQKYYGLLKRAQRYSVNVFSNVWEQLQEQSAVHEIQEGEGIYYLDERYYSKEFGLTTEAVATAQTIIC